MTLSQRALGLVAATLLFGSTARTEDTRPETEMRQRLDRATAAFEAGRFEDARREYEAATKKDPGSIRAWTGLGWSLWQLGQREQAFKIWTDVLKVAPNEPKILLALGQAYEAETKWDEALSYYDRLVKANVELREARLGRARVLEGLGRWNDAETTLHQVLHDTPGDMAASFELARVYLKLNRNDEAQRILKELAARQPDPKYLRLLGDGMMALGRYDDAADYYRKSLVRTPDHRGTVLSLARAYARNHRFSDAVGTLKPWTGRHPDDDQARAELAKYAESSGDFSESEQQLRELMRRHPDDVRWPIQLAKGLRLAGQPDRGSELARQVLEKDPRNVDALGYLADDAFLTGHEEEAIRLLEQLASVEPLPARLNQLGRLRITRGDRLQRQGDDKKAQAEYHEAERVFALSTKLDPTESDAPLGYIAAKRLGGDPEGAIAETQKMLQGHPNLLALRRELYEGYLQVNDYDNAEKYIAELQQGYPGNVILEQQRALVEFNSGDRSQGVQRLQALLQKPINQRVPILLYHGISATKRVPGALAVESFRDQMQALKRAGYQSITLAQFIDFVDGKEQLPPKPILITFDDARADSMRNADPVLREVGYGAAMFIPAGEIAQHGPYYAAWRTLRDMQATGRWEMECHAYLGHRRIPVDAEGHEGLFFTDRQWLPDKGRAETEQEFYQRLDQDYRSCRQVVEQEIPGAHVVGYAYPFGDLGQRRFSNEPNALKINTELVSKYYRVAFVEDPYGMATPQMAHFRFPRYEMPIDANGEDLIRQLNSADPENSTLFLLGNLYSYSGDFAQANALYDEVERKGFDKPTLLSARAQSRQWNGDFAGAREFFLEAAQLRPEDPLIARKIDALNEQEAPTLQATGLYYHDNADRTNFSVGPVGKVYLNDLWSVSANYQYREFRQDNLPLSDFPSATGTTTTTTTTTTTIGTADLRADGNQFEGQIEYQSDARTGFALAGGAAHFTDKSSQHLLKGDDTFPLGSGRVSFGLGDYIDVAMGGSRGYVPAVGTILNHLEYTGGLGQMRVHLFEDVTAFVQGGGDSYDDGNRRLDGLFRLTKKIWDYPPLEIGYQLAYDDTQEKNPFFYTPDRFIANEGVLSFVLGGSDQPVTLHVAAALGEGSERNTNAEFEGSASGDLEYRLGKHFRLIASGGRTQSATFSSYEASGALSFRF